MSAAVNGNLETVKTLLNHGVDLTMQDDKGRTALEMAEGKDNNEIVDLLSNTK
jgi:ankyrin repeat protein